MNHLIAGKKLGRNSTHRKALLKNMADSLVIHGRIKTTLAKAKFAKPYIEKMITLGKKGGRQNIRLLNTKSNDKKVVKKIVQELAERYKNRNGGYLRIIKHNYRQGDAAPVAILELVDEKKQNNKDKEKIQSEKNDGTQNHTNKPKGKLNHDENKQNDQKINDQTINDQEINEQKQKNTQSNDKNTQTEKNDSNKNNAQKIDDSQKIKNDEEK